MRVWHFTEQSYVPGWSQVEGPIRILPPSAIVEPEVTHQLLNRFLDEWALADELGLDIMVNEHHTTMTCLSPAVGLHLAILARITGKARLLGLGWPVSNRMDPFRVAEEIALIDVMSGGRLEVGLVKGVPYEFFSSNVNPVGAMDRLWEAHDLIVKALTTHDGPFSWEGEHFQYRNVNVFPRCFQQPHPPMWIPTSSATSARQIGERGYVAATFMASYHTKTVYDAYRAAFMARFGNAPANDRFAYLGLAVVAGSDSEARIRAEKMQVYLKNVGRNVPATVNPPGYVSVADNARLLMTSTARPRPTVTLEDGSPLPNDPSVEDLASAGILFWGTPDRVFRQIATFSQRVGGFGHFLMEGQAGTLTHDETADSLRLFAREVLPRLRELD